MLSSWQNITARLRNALGGGESLEGQASVGTKTKSAYSISLSTPLFGSPLLSFALSGFSFDRDNTAFASHRELAQGGRAKLSVSCDSSSLARIQLMPGDSAVGIARSAVRVHCTGHYASAAGGISVVSYATHLPACQLTASVRELARPSTKSALSHTYTRDTRDDPWLGTRGQLLKITHVSYSKLRSS